ncbi:MAG: hypothetical protein HQL91_06605 [Magnetococcales bacterium]|nr:hypothetical protein [Magnetococcales bacterium]
MHILHPLIALLGRFPFYVAVGILVTMPLGGHWVKNAHQEFMAAKERLDLAKRTRAEQEQQTEKNQQNDRLAEEVRQFIRAVEAQRLSELQGWTTYTVDIRDKELSARELRALLAQAGPSPRFYFKPKRLEITSLFAKELLPARLQNLMQGKPGGGAQASRTEPPPIAGEKVLVSLSGQFLLFPRN